MKKSGDKIGKNLVKVREALKKIHEYVPGENVTKVKKLLGLKKVIKLASNENPYGPSPKVLEVLRSFKDLNIYPEPDPLDLREKIAEYTNSKAENVVIGAGIDGILDNIFKMMVDPGDSVLIPIPTFPYYHTLSTIYNAKQIFVKRNSNFEIITEDIFNSLDNKTKIIFICSPNNPTGNSENISKVTEVVEECKNSLIFIDEAYAEFSKRKLLDLTSYENVVIARTFSKAFGLANLRIGYAILSKKLRKEYLKVNPPFSVSSLAKIAAIKALEDLDYLKWVVKQNTKERAKLIKKLKELKFFKVYNSDANFVFIKAKIEGQKIVQMLLRRGIIIRDCSKFLGCSRYDIRISVGREDENNILLHHLRGIIENLE